MDDWKLNKVKFCIKCMDYRVPNPSFPDVGDVCKVCESKLEDTGMNYLQFDLKSEQLYESLKNKKILIAMQKLKETDPVKYEIAMGKYKNKIVNEEKISKQQQPNTPKCPYCQSTNLNKIGTLGRVASVSIFGLASKKIGKQWHCKDCESDF